MRGSGAEWEDGRKRDDEGDDLEMGVLWSGMKEEWRVKERGVLGAPWELGFGGLRVREEKEEEREEMVDMAEEDGGGRGRGQNSSVRAV